MDSGAAARHGATPASAARDARPPARRLAAVDRTDRSAARADGSRRGGARSASTPSTRSSPSPGASSHVSERGAATGAWDRLRVEQVCRNLLSNAIRFGAGRPIEVTVDADHDFAQRRRCATTASALLPISRRRSSSGSSAVSSSAVAASASGCGSSATSAPRWAAPCPLRAALGEGACFTVMLPRHAARQGVEPDRSDLN